MPSLSNTILTLISRNHPPNLKTLIPTMSTLCDQQQQQQQPKRQWGELEEGKGGEDLDFQLQSKKIFEVDNDTNFENIIENKFNDEDYKLKVDTTCRIRKLAQNYLNKKAYERSWPKLGYAVRKDAGAEQEDTKVAPDNPFGGGGAVIMVCTTCGMKGDHWPYSCPSKDLGQPPDEIEPQPGGSAQPDGPDEPDEPDEPDGLRARAGLLADMRRRTEQHSVRVINLSEDTTEEVLQELFGPCGEISRVYVAMDCRTGRSRGFGFVNFANMEDAERAINELDGYGHDNLTLRVEWANPRVNYRLGSRRG